MEFTEAAQRLLHHWKLVLVFLGWTLFIPVALHQTGEDVYVASARVTAGGDVASAEGAEALVDSAIGVVTSPSQINRALARAGVVRDRENYAEEHLDVESVGISSVLIFSVSDSDPNAAAAIANALAGTFVESRRTATTDPIEDRVGELSAELATVEERIAEIENSSTPSDSPVDPVTLEFSDALERRSEIRAQIDQLNQRLLSQGAPVVTDAAIPPPAAEPRRLAVNLVIGGMLGLILGIAVAALVETLRPTIVGQDALARVLEAPVLGDLETGTPEWRDGTQLKILASRIQLAAGSAGVSEVNLATPDRSIDLESFAAKLRERIPGLKITVPGAQETDNPTPHLRHATPSGSRTSLVRPGIATPSTAGGSSAQGLVVVTPTVLQRSALNDVAHLLLITEWPLLGIVCLPHRHRRPTAESLAAYRRSSQPTGRYRLKVLRSKGAA